MRTHEEYVKVLVIDDDEMILRLVQLILEDEGYLVSTASSVAEARAVMARDNFQMLILDVHLPSGEPGLDFLAELRRNGCMAWVTVLTAWDVPKSRAGAIQAGANDYISKPFDVGDLVERVEAVGRIISSGIPLCRAG